MVKQKKQHLNPIGKIVDSVRSIEIMDDNEVEDLLKVHKCLLEIKTISGVASQHFPAIEGSTKNPLDECIEKIEAEIEKRQSSKEDAQPLKAAVAVESPSTLPTAAVDFGSEVTVEGREHIPKEMLANLKAMFDSTGVQPVKIEARLEKFDPVTGLASGELKTVMIKYAKEEDARKVGQKISKYPQKALDGNFYFNFIGNEINDLTSKKEATPAAAEPKKEVEELSVVRPSNEPHSTEVIDQWLFGGESKDGFPVSQLALKQGRKRFQENFAPKKSFSQVPMIGEGKYSSRMGVHSGGITDLKVTDGQTAAIGDSNNGDLLTGCGFAVATAVVNATGPNLQRDLYNRFGVPGVMEVPKYGEENYRKTEGRGYAVSCDAHDMRETHGIGTVEFLTVPMYSQEGVRNMYREAFAHSKDKDFIVLPMAGMSHPVLRGKPNLSANIATEEFRKFCDSNPDSKLKVVFAIYNDQASESLYKEAAINQDGILD